jgi:hypothetical protein
MSLQMTATGKHSRADGTLILQSSITCRALGAHLCCSQERPGYGKVWVKPECGYSPMDKTTLSTEEADHVIPPFASCYIERAESITFFLHVYLVVVSKMSIALKRLLCNGQFDSESSKHN